MKREPDYERMSVADQLREALTQSLDQVRGVRTLRSVTLPAPAPKLSKSRVIAIRKRAGMSQAVFARYLNVPAKTLQSWEQGARTPKAGEARLLQLFGAAPDECARLVTAASRPAPRRTIRPGLARK